ncbi:TonB-linked outer membrane protein, SusC/RagA family [Pustulibacterium marinum]|uniref:TonB-linked outer membrane protein, SusC/RagA family n=1 Tax=Pustulibacterium marinum TaxID=1224947 RepID=A0A1I7GWE5_9FLAO|nr:TonB-dependent receptor [Pustulibacterium marinum]SFU52768.1 TonB-linked outer membrane protein, SusC/RagA family [Pustulibacterium marinum]
MKTPRSCSLLIMNDTKFLCFFLLLASLVGFNANAQNKVTGTITDTDGVPIPGATILEKNTTNGVTTDFDGNYEINVVSNSSVLVFSYLGYKTKELTVGNNTNLDVILETDMQALDEVVVIGYGEQKREQVTSAVSSIKAEDFNPGKIQDAAELVKGKISGLVVTKSSGDPNATSTIMLRGVTTLNGSVSPLILIDGVPGDLTMIAPENIASIDVLKDASAAAIYGTRGANGVILITSKSGKLNAKTQIVYDAYASVSDFYKEADFMTPADIRLGRTSFSDDGWDTDWLDAVTQTGYTQNHSLLVNGGSDNTTYSANLSYKYEEGTIKRSDNDQLRLQLNVGQYFFNKVLKVDLKLFQEFRNLTPNNASAGGVVNIYRQAVIRNPTSPIYAEDTGAYYEEFGRFQYYNPVAMLNELIGEDEIIRSNIVGNVTLEPIKNWKTNLMVAQNTLTEDYSTYATSNYYTSTTTGYSGSAYKSFGKSKSKFLELTSNYDFTINALHRFNILAGYSYTYNVSSGFNASNSDFPTDAYLYNNIAVGAQLKEGEAYMSSSKSDNTLIGFFGRLSYGFSNKFNILASIRREGSSQFGENHKWGLFPSASAGYTISNESFLKDVSWLDNLKLRVGYGVTGQRPNANYLSLTTYNYDSSYGNFLNEDGEWVAGLMVTQNPNPDLKWEKTSEVNFGLDFSFLNNKISGSLDVYNKTTDDLLYSYNVPVPPNLFGTTLANVGSIRNQGIEIMLTALPVETQNFSWNTTITASRNRNKLLSLSNDLYETENYLNVAYAGDPISVPTHRVEVGQSIGNFWGLKSVGVTDDGIWLIEDPSTGEAIPYTTSLNTDDYRQYLGNGFPKVYFGWNNTLTYKKFDLMTQFSGQLGFKILNTQRMFYENNSIQYNRLRSAADPVYGNVPLSSSQAQAFVSYYLEDGDFLKLDNVTLGYTFVPKSWSDYVSKIRFYCSAKNFLTITKYKGLDPELANSDFYAAGNDFRDKYPTIRSLTLGLNVTF